MNQEKLRAASDIIDHLEVTPRDLGLEKSVADDEALRLLFSRYYERLGAEHTRVQIQVIWIFVETQQPCSIVTPFHPVLLGFSILSFMIQVDRVFKETKRILGKVKLETKQMHKIRGDTHMTSSTILSFLTHLPHFVRNLSTGNLQNWVIFLPPPSVWTSHVYAPLGNCS